MLLVMEACTFFHTMLVVAVHHLLPPMQIVFKLLAQVFPQAQVPFQLMLLIKDLSIVLSQTLKPFKYPA